MVDEVGSIFVPRVCFQGNVAALPTKYVYCHMRSSLTGEVKYVSDFHLSAVAWLVWPTQLLPGCGTWNQMEGRQ